MTARHYRYGIVIPPSGNAPGWAWWNGETEIVLGGTTFRPGQWCSYALAPPVSGIASGKLSEELPTILRFAATGLFRAWLQAGDAADRRATLYDFAAEDAVWSAKSQVLDGELGGSRQTEDGLIEVEFRTTKAPRPSLPLLLTVAAHQADRPEFEHDTHCRHGVPLARGYEEDYP